MTEMSWPFDGVDTTETQYSYLMRRLQTDGVWGTVETSDLKVYADSSGMQVKLPAGFANIRGFTYQNDAVKILPLVAAESQPRIDSVVLLLDLTGNSITAVVKKGTASTTPTPPTINQPDTGNFELEIARLAVAANASTMGPSTVTDRRTFMAHQFGVWTTALRPTSPRRGLPGFNLTTGIPEFWDGSKWSNFAPPTLDSTTLVGEVPNAALPSRLSSASADNIVTDWNAATSTGWYVSQTGSVNSPDTNKLWAGAVIRYSGNLCIQTLIWFSESSSTPSYMRRIRNSSGTWGSWYRVGLSSAESDALADLVGGSYFTKDALNNGALDSRYFTESEITSKLSSYLLNGNNNIPQSALPFRIAGGAEVLTGSGSSAPYTATKHVNFPTGRFTSGAPIVTTGIDTTAKTDSFAGAQNITSTGFDLFFKRDDKVSTGIYWIALDMTV